MHVHRADTDNDSSNEQGPINFDCWTDGHDEETGGSRNRVAAWNLLAAIRGHDAPGDDPLTPGELLALEVYYMLEDEEDELGDQAFWIVRHFRREIAAIGAELTRIANAAKAKSEITAKLPVYQLSYFPMYRTVTCTGTSTSFSVDPQDPGSRPYRPMPNALKVIMYNITDLWAGACRQA